LAVLAIIWLVQFAQPVLVPVVLAVLISYILEPAVAQLQKVKIPRPIGAGIVLLCAAAVLAMGIYFLSDDLLAVIDDLPKAANKLRATLDRNEPNGVVGKVKEAATAVERTATEAAGQTEAPDGVTRVQVQQKPVDLSGFLVWGSMGLLSWAGSVVLLGFLIYFLLMSGNLFRRKLLTIAGRDPARRKLTVDILDEIGGQITRWLVVQIFSASVVAIASFAALRLIGLERAGTWGIIAGIFNTIPYFGPLVVSAGLAVVAFVQFGTLQMVIGVSAVALMITALEGYLLTPYVAGRAMRMNGVAVFVGLLFWTWLWHVWGVFLALPMLVITKSICDHVEGLQPIGELLGE
jgi:predicted PurR-regulated permease PerM